MQDFNGMEWNIFWSGAKEASALYCGHFMRSFIFSRAKINFKLGKFEDCLSDCEAFVHQCEINNLQRHHLLLVRCLCLKASALRSQNLLTSTNASAKSTFQDCLHFLRKARNIAESLATQSGETTTTTITTTTTVTATIIPLLLPLLLLLYYYYYYYYY